MRYLSDAASARIDRILSATTDNFVELAQIAGLLPLHDFHHAHLRGVDFGGSHLTGFDFTDTVFDACKFRGARLAGATLTGTKFRGCDPSDALDWNLVKDKFGIGEGPDLQVARQAEINLPAGAADEVLDLKEDLPRIVIVGVGNAGCNALGNISNAGIDRVTLVAANTDAQQLASTVGEPIQLGPSITQGLGAGSRPEIGRAAAEESADKIRAALDGAGICFVAAGMGGGTGTGAAPLVARIARGLGILTVGVVSKPFSFEGARRSKAAEDGIAELRQVVDTLIVIPNQNLFLIANPDTTFRQAFDMADDVLFQAVRCITDLLLKPGRTNLNIEEFGAIMRKMDDAAVGIGIASGDDRAIVAAQRALGYPLVDGIAMAHAKGLIVSISGSEAIRHRELDEAANQIRKAIDPEANIIWGSSFDEKLGDQLRVTIIATGIVKDGGYQRAIERAQHVKTAVGRPVDRPDY